MTYKVVADGKKVYLGDNIVKAREAFDLWAQRSYVGDGISRKAPVYLLADGETIEEFYI